MQIKPLTPHMGAEISDVDLKRVGASDLAEIKGLFTERMVLVFRGQTLTRDQHKAFARHFGELHVHPSKRSLDTKGDPEIFAIKTTPDSRWTNGEGWHTDVSCEPVPPMGSMLYVRELPGESGGDTLFANMCEAFATLSPRMQAWLRTLRAFHDGHKDLRSYNIKLRPGQTYPQAEHPVVTRHPESGRPVLFVNRSFTDRILEMERAESDALLALLWDHTERNSRLQCRVRWEPGTLTLWDNRCTLHHAVWDYYPKTRYAERVSIRAADPPIAAG